MVPEDNYIIWDPVWIYHVRCKLDPSELFSGVCVFVNLASGFMIIKHQVAINASKSMGPGVSSRLRGGKGDPK